jgi:hypothetical protein|tara:strand:- start:304 stop:711 length:408 start_codon:yes stop_codon:yes gene_type:complete
MKKTLSTKSKFLKRDPIKYIRDKAKSAYEKGDECRICGKKAKLDFHHFYSLSPLLDKWLIDKVKVRPEHYTEEYITIWREEFIEDNWAELYDHTVTLCKEHHLQLHSVYGRNPALVTAQKQMRWVGIQRDKYGLV